MLFHITLLSVPLRSGGAHRVRVICKIISALPLRDGFRYSYSSEAENAYNRFRTQFNLCVTKTQRSVETLIKYWFCELIWMLILRKLIVNSVEIKFAITTLSKVCYWNCLSHEEPVRSNLLFCKKFARIWELSERKFFLKISVIKSFSARARESIRKTRFEFFILI